MKHGKNFTLGEYVIIKKPDLMTIGDNVRISDFCRISSACDIGSDCEIAPGTYIAGGDGKYTFKMGECSSLAAGVKVWLSSNDYVNELVTHSDHADPVGWRLRVMQTKAGGYAIYTAGFIGNIATWKHCSSAILPSWQIRRIVCSASRVVIGAGSLPPWWCSAAAGL